MSRIWSPRSDVTGIKFGQAAAQYYWDIAYNPYLGFYEWYPYQGAPGAVYCNTYNLALPNCTAYAYGRIMEAGDPAPHGPGLYNAASWHNHLANGWAAEAYSPHTIRAGDIVEWVSGNHVAVIEGWDSDLGLIYVSQSLYTSDNGTASGDRTDTIWGSTKASVSNYGSTTYPERFFKYADLYWVNLGTPDYILRNPNSVPGTVGTFKFMGVTKNRKRRRILYV